MEITRFSFYQNNKKKFQYIVSNETIQLHQTKKRYSLRIYSQQIFTFLKSIHNSLQNPGRNLQRFKTDLTGTFYTFPWRMSEKGKPHCRLPRIRRERSSL